MEINGMNIHKPLFVILYTVLFAVCHAAERPDAAENPNIILFIGDDISWDDFGCYGHPSIQTPNIDKLAANGIRFTNAYLTSPQCSPTRTSVISGRYPHNTGAPELHQPLPEGQPMFPLELKNAGYHTAASGKWHMGEHAKTAFDKVLVDRSRSGSEGWVKHLQERPKDKPFFMWFDSRDAHRPWDSNGKHHQPSDAVIPPYMADMDGTREDLARYYDEVRNLDQNVGLVVQELEKQKVSDNTIIIFMADNGRPFPRDKTWLYDGGIKMPFIVYWLREVDKAGETSSSLVSAIDIAPTILEMAGLKSPEGFQGVSMIPVLMDPEATIRNYAFAERNWHDTEGHMRMVRHKQWTYIRNARPERAALAPAQLNELSYLDLLALKRDGKLTAVQANIFQEPRPAEELFDVDADPHQLDNLADKPEFAGIMADLRNVMDEWQERTGDTVPKVLTPDNIDRKTGQRLGPWNKPNRGTIPGSERNATTLNDPGPRL